nr:hypothetical protein [Tanacetum cinerariifolium]
MHNNIMTAGLRDRPPMLATRRYAQWKSRFLRYIDTRPNGDALRKCILKGPYTPSTVTIPAVPATYDNPAAPEQIAIETLLNMTLWTIKGVLRLQAIVSHLEFMDVPIEQDDLNQKFLTSLAPEWIVYTIVWRNTDDLNTMSLDDVYNHLKVYEPKVQKRAGSNSQNMAFISSSNNSSGKSEVPTVQGASTASTQVSTVSTDVAAASLSYDTVCVFIATQPNGSQIKYEDISQIDDDDI